MKQTKKPTRDLKEIIAKNGLDPAKWRLVSQDKGSFTILDNMGNIKVLAKN